MTSAPPFPPRLHVRAQEPMARHTSFGVGGPADYWVEVRRLDTLRLALASAEALGMPRTVMGHGTNALVADAGVEGLVIYNRCSGFDPRRAAGMVLVESGHGMARLAGRCAQLGLGGLGFAIGVPGTVGGAVFGNAGAFGSDVAAVLHSALVWLPGGEGERPARAFEFGYRRSRLQTEAGAPVVLRAALRVEPAAVDDLRRELDALVQRRRATQPRGRNAGSFFANPEGDFAGRLIDALGMRGLAVGGAFVSRLHANFLSTRNGATARDVLELALQVKRRVADACGVRLTPEVRLLGRWNASAQELFA